MSDPTFTRDMISTPPLPDRSGRTYLAGKSRWRGDDGTPLMLGAMAGSRSTAAVRKLALDKAYVLTGHLVIGSPAAEQIIATAGTDLELSFDGVFAKDSLDLVDDDRRLLLERLQACDTDRVLVRHGTDTMTDTAEFLTAHAGDSPDKVVVLTGAMKPACLRDSDAAFNLGASIAALQTLEPGMYVRSSGRVFPAGSVAKDRVRGRFVDRPEASSVPDTN